MGSLHLSTSIVRVVAVSLMVTGCAKGSTGTADSGNGRDDGAVSTADASCGDLCDHDHDGVVDGSDQCPDTSPMTTVNHLGCSDSQLTPVLAPTFPPYGLTWTPTGDLGKAGGLTWTYTGIERGDLFHIYWVVCDDPATPCGLSLDGPIDVQGESWQFSAADSDLANGKLVLTNATRILLADASTPALTGRLTVTIMDAAAAPLRFAPLATLGVTGRIGQYAAEITGAGFKVVTLAEVQDSSSATWTPYIDYYNAASTPVAGGGTTTSFGGSFYAK